MEESPKQKRLQAKQLAKKAGKAAIKAAAKGALKGALLKILTPVLGALLAFMLFFSAIALLLGVFFAPLDAASQFFNFTSDPDKQSDVTFNKNLEERYKRVADSTVDQAAAKKIPEMNLYKVSWGLLAAIDKISNNCEDPNPEAYATALKPIFHTKTITKTTVVKSDPGSTTTQPEDVEVIDSVDTWQGKYQFSYQMISVSTSTSHEETYTYPDGLVMKEGKRTVTVTTTVTGPQVSMIEEPVPKDYSKVVNFLKGKDVDHDNDIELVLNLAKNYDMGGGLDLTNADDLVSLYLDGLVQGAGTPPPDSLIPLFKAAAERYHGKTDAGEFAALLMAISYTESSFKSNAINGIMGLKSALWQSYGMKQLGYTAADIQDPAKSITAAALMLSAYAGDGTDEGIQKAIALYNSSQSYIDEVTDRMYFYGTYSGWTTAGGVPNSKGFVWPLPGYYSLSTLFGPRIHPVTGQAGFHTGIDIPAPMGTVIKAAKAGTIISVEYNTVAYGTSITIDHGQGVTTFYGHMKNVYPGIEANMIVQAGQSIAYVASEGYSTGPHLHFEVRTNGNPINPLLVDSPPK